MPAKSKAQLGMMFHLENIGKVSKGTGKHWARETKKLKGGIKGLPAHVKKSETVLRNQTAAEKAQEFVAGLFKQAGPMDVLRRAFNRYRFPTVPTPAHGADHVSYPRGPGGALALGGVSGNFGHVSPTWQHQGAGRDFTGRIGPPSNIPDSLRLGATGALFGAPAGAMLAEVTGASERADPNARGEAAGNAATAAQGVVASHAATRDWLAAQRAWREGARPQSPDEARQTPANNATEMAPMPERVSPARAALENTSGPPSLGQSLPAPLPSWAMPAALGAGVFGTGALGAVGGGALGAGLGAFRGNTAEGLGRGVVRGGTTGIGAGLGGLLAAALADKAAPGHGSSIPGLVGAGLGGLGGYAAGGAMLGEPTGDGKKKKEEEKAAEAKSFIASLFKNATGRGIGGMTGSSSAGGSAGGGGGSISGGGISGGGISGGASRVTSSISTTGPVGGGLRSPLGGAGVAPVMPGVAATALAAPVPRLGAMATVGS